MYKVFAENSILIMLNWIQDKNKAIKTDKSGHHELHNLVPFSIWEWK